MTRADILHEAERLICGERHEQHGDAAENFADIALGWDRIARRVIERGGSLQPQHVALMMCWLKSCRALNGSSEDTWIDLAGYAALGGEADRVTVREVSA